MPKVSIHWRNYAEYLIDNYKNIVLMNSYIRTLAQEKDVVLVDLYNGLVGNWYAYTFSLGTSVPSASQITLPISGMKWYR